MEIVETASLDEVASQFLPSSQSATIREFGNGNINRTYLVTPEGGASEPFLMQCLNTRVFQAPELVMQNIRAVSVHVAKRPYASVGRRWEMAHVLTARDGADHWRSPDGAFWRAQRFITPTHAIDTVHDAARAREVGHALGTFHSLLSDLPTDELADTLPGFHVAPGYMAKYDAVARTPIAPLRAEEQWCHQFIADHRAWVPVLEEAHAQGVLRRRVIHGDPKVNNILFDDATGRAIAMIDLDTVKPGLVQYDIGDCLRSACNPDGEETANWQDVRFDLELAKAMLEGYLSVARDFFEDADFDFLPDAVRLLAFELGLRFFTDHLEGDVYFKVARRGQNLSRALVQLRLAQRIDESFDELRGVVQSLR